MRIVGNVKIILKIEYRRGAEKKWIKAMKFTVQREGEI